MQGGFGPGIFRPGASSWIDLDLDPSIHRYLTFGSMVVPSNDAFIGNNSPCHGRSIVRRLGQIYCHRFHANRQRYLGPRELR